MSSFLLPLCRMGWRRSHVHPPTRLAHRTGSWAPERWNSSLPAFKSVYGHMVQAHETVAAVRRLRGGNRLTPRPTLDTGGNHGPRCQHAYDHAAECPCPGAREL
jgi:hypothetical protein